MIDLHCHSIFSDGSSTPEELIELAEKIGLSALALTDHDTIEGLPRLFKAGKTSSIKLISGIELSVEYENLSLHILGYGFDLGNCELNDALKWVRDGRATRNEKIIDTLNTLGFSLTIEDVEKYSTNGVVGRPHIAEVLVEKGHFSHKTKVFKQLLGKGCPAYFDRNRLTAEKSFELIRNAGGVSSIAHPGQLRFTRNKLRKLVRKLKEQGLCGVEAYHPTHKPHQMKSFEKMCSDFDLIVTGGSDFHGSYKPNLYLGTGFGNLTVEDEIFDKLKFYLQQKH